MAVLNILKLSSSPLSLPEISQKLSQQTENTIPERTLRRWLVGFVESGLVTRSGKKRGTKYFLNQSQWTPDFTGDSGRFYAGDSGTIHDRHPHVGDQQDVGSAKELSGTILAGDPNSSQTYSIKSPDGEYRVPHIKFLDDIPKHRRPLLLTHIRDLWTHSSTALEGNTLSLGDTHFLLEEGLTISGKPLREHQEVIGHARAIELIYNKVASSQIQLLIEEEFLFALHRAVQTEVVIDIYKPNGAWKVEINGVYVLDEQGAQLFIEFAEPKNVPALMQELMHSINSIDSDEVKLINAPAYYAKIHLGITQIHPFWDGNGRIARLLANLLLIKAGLPPLVIDASKRREYIEILSRYSIAIGQLDKQSGVWPDAQAMNEFIAFCATCYEQSKALIENAKANFPNS